MYKFHLLSSMDSKSVYGHETPHVTKNEKDEKMGAHVMTLKQDSPANAPLVVGTDIPPENLVLVPVRLLRMLTPPANKRMSNLNTKIMQTSHPRRTGPMMVAFHLVMSSLIGPVLSISTQSRGLSFIFFNSPPRRFKDFDMSVCMQR